jgi:hypothetical protein
MRYLDRDGQPLTLQQWTQQLSDERIAVTQLPSCIVSTIWVGVDVGDGLIFETVVLRGGDVTDCERYATELEAVEGHLRCVRSLS